jgi:hypothetical protein
LAGREAYNSARAQSADVRILHQYRKVILGQAQLTDRVRCWIHLVPPTNLLAPSGPCSARRDERDEPYLEEAQWFRIGQFRLPSQAGLGLGLVQRIVLINSFAFTLLIAPEGAEWPCDEFEQWTKAFADAYPAAKPILPAMSRAIASTGSDHAAHTFVWLLQNYPSRYGDDPNPLLVAAIKGDIGGFLVYVPHELVQEGDIEPIAKILHDMVGTREQVIAYNQRVSLMVAGFDDDPRALWQIPEARDFLRRLFVECPFIMLLS